MNVVSKLTQAATAVMRWHLMMEYPRRTVYDADHRHALRISEALHALPRPPSPEQVQDIIGEAWVSVPPCGECGLSADVVVRLAGAHVCEACLHKAATLLEGQP